MRVIVINNGSIKDKKTKKVEELFAKAKENLKEAFKEFYVKIVYRNKKIIF